MGLFSKSIRWRLLFWLGALLVVVLSVLMVAVYQLNRLTQLEQIDEALRVRVAALTSDLRKVSLPAADSNRATPPDFNGSRRPPPPPTPGVKSSRPPPSSGRVASRSAGELPLVSPETLRLFDETDPLGYYYAAWLPNDQGAKIAGNAGIGLMLPRPPSTKGPLYKRTRDTYRELFYFTERGDCVLTGISITGYLDGLNRLAWWLTLAAVAVLLFGLGGGWLLIGRALRPVEAIGATADRIAAGNLSERIDVRETENELGRLATVLNSTFGRLEAAFVKQKHFTADASHELRTPLTVIISEIEATLSRDRSAADYRESLSTCLDAARQMQRLADSLLALARFDSGSEPLQRSHIDLAPVARATVDLVRPLAAARSIELKCELLSAHVNGDAVRLGQVLVNLLTNAIHHSREGGEICVQIKHALEGSMIVVADNGQGISPEDLPHIFDRFYRADRSRSAAQGRSGLGLAISKMIVEAHAGTISVESIVGTGTKFTVLLRS